MNPKRPEDQETEAPPAEEAEEVVRAEGRDEEPPDEEDAEAAAARAVEAELEGEESAAERLSGELEELRDRHLRLAAEFENYRKRTREELLKTREMAQADLARKLLDALDDLGRIADLPAESTTVEALHEGVALVERKLWKELGEAGLEPLEAEGQPFDPTYHEALSTVPTDDPDEDEVVSRVFLGGYRFKDRLVRPARVEVKKYSP